MISNHKNTRINQERGSALVYILIAIALLAALTVTFMKPSSQQTSSQGSFRTIANVKNQVDTIMAAVQSCLLTYRKGDALINVTVPGSDPNARKNLPIKPNSTHYTGATIGATVGRLVKDIRCPGNPGNNDNNHAHIFGRTSGKTLPPIPALFEDWQYYNGKDGVFFWIKTNKTDAFINTALQKLDDQYDECEADIVDATAAAKDLDSLSEVTCEVGYKCFRFRMTKKSFAVYNGDTDGEEAAAGCP